MRKNILRRFGEKYRFSHETFPVIFASACAGIQCAISYHNKCRVLYLHGFGKVVYSSENRGTVPELS